MAIEFRVQGEDSAKVAQELADQMQLRFHVKFSIRRIAPPPNPAGGASGEKFDPHLAILAVHAALAAFEVYMKFFHEPSERRRLELVGQWRDLILWSRSKLPTKIRAVIGAQALFLHESDPEQLHHLTKKAMESAAATAK